MPTKSSARLAWHWWPTLTFGVIILFLIRPLWWDAEVLAFRDALHFYYPLWTFIDSMTLNERILPRFNPLDAFGSSIVGEPTSMVFYPLRFLLHLPLGSLEQRIGWFVVIHLAIAYSTFVVVGLRCGMRLSAVQLSAGAYALSGPVFFQLYNPPFLVGAAWLPAAMLSVLIGCRVERADQGDVAIRRRTSDLGWPVMGLTMMVLGGDAQSAFHVAMLVIMVGLFVAVSRAVVGRDREEGFFQRTEPLKFGVLVIGLAIGFSAAQIVPSLHWLKQSERGDRIPSPEKAELNSVAEPTLESPASPPNRYSFSQRTWHYATLIAPNFYGSFVPIHTRWAQAIPGDGRVWTPSLHVGLIVLTLALTNWRTGWPSPVSKLTLFVGAIAFLSSLGQGGLYDVWNNILPGYVYFRYPAKWTTFVAWAICMAASMDDRLLSGSRRIWLLVGVGCLGAAMLMVNVACFLSDSFLQWIYTWLSRVSIDPWCGPLDRQQAIRNFGLVGLIASLVGLLNAWFVFRGYRQAIVILCMVELGMAAASQFSSVPRELVRLGAIEISESQQHPSHPMSIRDWEFGDFRQRFVSEATITAGKVVEQESQNRLKSSQLVERSHSKSWSPVEQNVIRQSAGLLAKLHLLIELRNFQADFTLRPRAIGAAMHHDPQTYWRHQISETLANGTSSARRAAMDDQTTFTDVRVEGSRIEFAYTAIEPLMLELPILNDGGWRQLNDNEAFDKFPIDVTSTATGLLKLDLPIGQHGVRLHYWPPGLSLGLFVSSITALVCGGAFVLARTFSAKM